MPGRSSNYACVYTPAVGMQGEFGQLPYRYRSSLGRVRHLCTTLIVVVMPEKEISVVLKECAAVYCKNKEGAISSFSFHKFPSGDKEPERLKQWVINMMKRADPEKSGKLWQPKIRDRLCPKEESECFTLAYMFG